jgi:hypothetical protein
MIAAIVLKWILCYCVRMAYQTQKLIYALPTAGDVFASKQLTFSHALDHF